MGELDVVKAELATASEDLENNELNETCFLH